MTWALVTGGAKRLGAAICKKMAENGSDVIVHYHNSHEEALEVVEACRAYGVRAECLSGDFSTAKSTSEFIHALQKQFPEVHTLINNVGNYPSESALHTNPEQWNALFQVNLHAPFALIHALLPSLIKSQGSIINIGVSGLSAMRAAIKATAYRATKMGLWCLTKSLAKELAPFQVRVNMVSPGQLSNSIDSPKDLSALPMGYPGNLDDVTQVISFLLDPKNRYITGQNIEVAGGLGL